VIEYKIILIILIKKGAIEAVIDVTIETEAVTEVVTDGVTEAATEVGTDGATEAGILDDRREVAIAAEDPEAGRIEVVTVVAIEVAKEAADEVRSEFREIDPCPEIDREIATAAAAVVDDEIETTVEKSQLTSRISTTFFVLVC
jgi:hypothetical protein